MVAKLLIFLLIIMVISADQVTHPLWEDHSHTHFLGNHELYKQQTLSVGNVAQPTLEPNERNGNKKRLFRRLPKRIRSQADWKQAQFLSKNTASLDNIMQRRHDRIFPNNQ